MALLFQDLATLVQLQEPLKRLKDPYNVGAPDARFSEMGSHNLRCCGVAVGVGGQSPPSPKQNDARAKPVHRKAMQQAKRCTGCGGWVASLRDATQAEQSDATPSGAKRCNPKQRKSMHGLRPPQPKQIVARGRVSSMANEGPACFVI